MGQCIMCNDENCPCHNNPTPASYTRCPDHAAEIERLKAQANSMMNELTTLRDAMEDITRENNEQAESLNKILDAHGGWDDSIDTYAGHFERIINTLTEERDANRRLLNKALKENALLRAECEAWRKNDDQYDDADESNTLWKAAYKARAATDEAGALKGVRDA